jgi:hypothetical protein
VTPIIHRAQAVFLATTYGDVVMTIKKQQGVIRLLASAANVGYRIRQNSVSVGDTPNSGEFDYDTPSVS